MNKLLAKQWQQKYPKNKLEEGREGNSKDRDGEGAMMFRKAKEKKCAMRTKFTYTNVIMYLKFLHVFKK